MPLFKKSSTKKKDESKKKDDSGNQKLIQHRLFVAEGSPEPMIDLSQCSLKEIPRNVYSMCSVLVKEVLLLHDNQLSTMFQKDCGTSSDLSSVRVLDLHNNTFKHLPEAICDLSSLQVLNLENNILKDLPDSIGRLTYLQTLNVKKNHLTKLPSSIGTLASLRTLDISENDITELPPVLCHIRTLETLIADWSKLTYPAKEILETGSTEKVMKALCQDSRIEYIPPSNFVLKVLSPHNNSPSTSSLTNALILQQQIDDTYARHLVDPTTQDLSGYERELQEQEEIQARRVEKEMKAQQDLVDKMAREHEEEQTNLEKYAQVANDNQQAVLKSIVAAEKKAAKLIERIMSDQQNSNKVEELLEQMENERLATDAYCKVKQEELDNLRKQEVMAAMKAFLKENADFEMLCEVQDSARKQSLDNALQSELRTGLELNAVLVSAQNDQAQLMERMSDEEQLQKAAFQALLVQEDSRHQRIVKDIQLIEQQLAELSYMEVSERRTRNEQTMNVLSSRRDDLAKMLMNLMHQRNEREVELKNLMVEMDKHREDSQVDYWLVQYQRLLDRKPQQLINREQELDMLIIKILEGADAADYIPAFARNRITLTNIIDLNDRELTQMGVHELGTRKNILHMIDKYRPQIIELPSTVQPSAPIDSPSPTEQQNVIARGVNTECCICMEKTSTVIFLNCGHVCCCTTCGPTVKECPLCRGVISQRIQLSS